MIKNYLHFLVGEAEKTIMIPPIIAKLVKKATKPTVLVIRCVDHHEYSLDNIVNVLEIFEGKYIQACWIHRFDRCV